MSMDIKGPNIEMAIGKYGQNEEEVIIKKKGIFFLNEPMKHISPILNTLYKYFNTAFTL